MVSFLKIKNPLSDCFLSGRGLGGEVYVSLLAAKA
jgi:hypothetical protein